MKRQTLLVGLSLIAGTLVACSPASAPAPAVTPTPTLDERVAEYVDTWGGMASQYEIILTADCQAASNLFDSAVANSEDDISGSPEWRAHTGYANAANERMLELDC